MGCLAIFHAAKFSFDRECAFLARTRGRAPLADEWNDIFGGCARGQNEAVELDWLWAPFMYYDLGAE